MFFFIISLLETSPKSYLHHNTTTNNNRMGTFNYLKKYLLLILMFVLFMGFSNGDQQLSAGFYSSTCPRAEEIVTSVVREAVLSDKTMSAVLLRLHFHDCFVQGCDGSILIHKDDNSEHRAFGHQGVRGFDVIERAKARLETECQGVVSCADIVAMAARDAVALSNGPFYSVQTGRRDGRISQKPLADAMPDVTDSIQQLKDKFRQKGLSDKDLVVLSAAHTIGTTACFFVTDRIYNFQGRGVSDPSINPSFIPELKAVCPKGGDNSVRLAMDRGSEMKFDTQILSNIKNGFAVLQSDAKLYEDEATKSVVDSYSGFLSFIFGPSFTSDFVESMVKMGQIEVKTGSQGEIRRVCNAVN